jgi:hypothetical protein
MGKVVVLTLSLVNVFGSGSLPEIKAFVMLLNWLKQPDIMAEIGYTVMVGTNVPIRRKMTKPEGKLMGKVIQFPAKSATDSDAAKLLKIADEIDAVILRNLDIGVVDARDIAGLLAHRLGTLMRHMDQKDKLWDVCEKVLKTQAVIE